MPLEGQKSNKGQYREYCSAQGRGPPVRAAQGSSARKD